MEWLPKLYDTLDGVAFGLRVWWAGHVGQAIRSLMLLATVLVLAAVSPAFRNLVIATIASFMVLELVYNTLGRTRPNRIFQASAKATT